MNWKEKADELGISIIFYYPNNYDSDIDGFCIVEEKAAFINKTRNQIVQDNTIWHEISHIEHSHSHYACQSRGFILKEEYEADKDMIRIRASEYLNEFDNAPEYIDVYNFLDYFQFARKLYDLAVQVFNELLGFKLSY